MSLPIIFNEPLSALQRWTEDLEYAYLLDHAAQAADPAVSGSPTHMHTHTHTHTHTRTQAGTQMPVHVISPSNDLCYRCPCLCLCACVNAHAVCVGACGWHRNGWRT
jgi:hypothetical protein